MKLRERLLIQSLIRAGVEMSEDEIYGDDLSKSWKEVVDIITVNVEEKLNEFYKFGDEVDEYTDIEFDLEPDSEDE